MLQAATLEEDTTRLWQLIVACIEDAFVDYFQLTDSEATSMRGRAQVSLARGCASSDAPATRMMGPALHKATRDFGVT